MASSSQNRIYVKFNNLTYEQLDIKLIPYPSTTTINPAVTTNTIQSFSNSNTSDSTSTTTTTTTTTTSTTMGLNATECGFTIAGYCPSYIENVAENSLACQSGLKRGDLIVKVNHVNCCRATLKTIFSLIKQSTLKTSNLTLTVYRHVRRKSGKVKIELKSSVQAKKQINTNNTNLINSSMSNCSNSMMMMMKMKKKKQQQQQTTTKTHRFTRVNAKLFTKIFKPSLWLSCAQPLQQQQNSNTTTNATFYYKEEVEEERKPCVTNLADTEQLIACERNCCKMLQEENKQQLQQQEQQEQQQQSNSDTGYETLSRYESLSRQNEQLNG